MKKSNIVIGIVGLGYVGLPLTLLFSKNPISKEPSTFIKWVTVRLVIVLLVPLKLIGILVLKPLLLISTNKSLLMSSNLNSLLICNLSIWAIKPPLLETVNCSPALLLIVTLLWNEASLFTVKLFDVLMLKKL